MGTPSNGNASGDNAPDTLGGPAMHFTLNLDRPRLLEVIFKDKGLDISFNVVTNGQSETVTYQGLGTPSPDLMTYRADLDSMLRRYTEQGSSAKVVCTKVRFKYDDDEREGIVLSGSLRFARHPGAMALNSPLRWAEHTDENQMLDPDDLQALREFADEVVLYLGGVRAQPGLFATQHPEDRDDA